MRTEVPFTLQKKPGPARGLDQFFLTVYSGNNQVRGTGSGDMGE